MPDALSVYDRYATAFKNKAFKPVYYFFGDEKYLVYRLQEVLVEQALAPHERDFNLSVIYGAEVDGKAAVAECSAYPMMAERRVVLIRDFEKMSSNDLFVAYTKNPSPTTVVLISSAGKGNTNPYRAIASAAESAKFDSLRDRSVGGWITREVESNGYRIRSDGAQMLSQLAGNDLRTLAGEIQKLLSFVGERRDISADDVLEVAGHSREYNVFELQKRVERKDFADSAWILERMLQEATNARGTALMAVSVLNAYFNKLSKLAGYQRKGIPSGELAKAAGVPSFFLKDYLAALSRFSPAEREEAIGALMAADMELKGGSERDERLILALLLRRLTKDTSRNTRRIAS